MDEAMRNITKHDADEDLVEGDPHLQENATPDMNEYETENESPELNGEACNVAENRDLDSDFALPTYTQLQNDYIVIKNIEQMIKIKILEKELADTITVKKCLEKLVEEEGSKLKMVLKRNDEERKKYKMQQSILKIQKRNSLLQELVKEASAPSCSKNTSGNLENDCGFSSRLLSFLSCSSKDLNDSSSSGESDSSSSGENDTSSSGETSNARKLKKKPEKSTTSESAMMKPETNDLTP